MRSLDFALIGHPETWDAVTAVLSALRGPDRGPVSREDVEALVPWLPPRPICRMTVRSTRGTEARGVYVDAFLPPDRLGPEFLRENLQRVRAAAECVVREGARITSLGGFSSILFEGRPDLLPRDRGTEFTTGNTLAAAFCVHGLARAVELAGRDLREETLLVVGASGDVGSGCARWLAPRVKRLLLCARHPGRLARIAEELARTGTSVVADTDLPRLVPEADLVLCAASLPAPTLDLAALPAWAIVCDAGYPKNTRRDSGSHPWVSFHGGLGQVTAGLSIEPDLNGILNAHPFPDVAQGCLLEGMALALEGRFESYSYGRGRITPERIDALYEIARRHGLVLAPLFDSEGPVEERISARAARSRRAA